MSHVDGSGAAASGNSDGEPDGQSAKSVLVTGAAGFIGSHLSDRMLDEGWQVWGLDNFDAFYEPEIKRRNLQDALARPGFHFVEGDIRDGVLLSGLLSDVSFDGVVHLAAHPGVRPSLEEPAACFDTNVMGTITLLEAMQVHHVRRFIFASCGSVEGSRGDDSEPEDAPADRPRSPFAASKRTGELLCHTYHHLYGFSAYCLRMFSVYGPRQRPDSIVQELVGLLENHRPVPVNHDRASAWDFTHVDDVVDGLVRVLTRMTDPDAVPEFEILDMGTGHLTTRAELVDELGDALGVEPEMEASDGRTREPATTPTSPTRAESILDWRPSRTVPEGLRAFVDWYRTSMADDSDHQMSRTGSRSNRPPRAESVL